jgi:hypothetical protein
MDNAFGEPLQWLEKKRTRFTGYRPLRLSDQRAKHCKTFRTVRIASAYSFSLAGGTTAMGMPRRSAFANAFIDDALNATAKAKLKRADARPSSCNRFERYIYCTIDAPGKNLNARGRRRRYFAVTSISAFMLGWKRQ